MSNMAKNETATDPNTTMSSDWLGEYSETRNIISAKIKNKIGIGGFIRITLIVPWAETALLKPDKL